MSVVPHAAPLPDAVRQCLARDAGSPATILAAAARKGNVCTESEAREQYYIAQRHFELGCWLHYYRDRVGRSANFADRVDCVRRCYEAGEGARGYSFYDVFDFGERQFDTCFEMGDGDAVMAALRKIASDTPSGPLATALARHHGWHPSSAEEEAAPADGEGGLRP